LTERISRARALGAALLPLQLTRGALRVLLWGPDGWFLGGGLTLWFASPDGSIG
jgi:hypothetical protein